MRSAGVPEKEDVETYLSGYGVQGQQTGRRGEKDVEVGGKEKIITQTSIDRRTQRLKRGAELPRNDLWAGSSERSPALTTPSGNSAVTDEATQDSERRDCDLAAAQRLQSKKDEKGNIPRRHLKQKQH